MLRGRTENPWPFNVKVPQIWKSEPFNPNHFPYHAPDGGYQEADRRNAATNGRKRIFLNIYVGRHELLPGCHVDPTVAAVMSTWMPGTDTLGKMHYFQSLVNDHSMKGLAQRGYTADEAYIALSEEDDRLYVMLQAKDSSSVGYKICARQTKMCLMNHDLCKCKVCLI